MGVKSSSYYSNTNLPFPRNITNIDNDYALSSYKIYTKDTVYQINNKDIINSNTYNKLYELINNDILYIQELTDIPIKKSVFASYQIKAICDYIKANTENNLSSLSMKENIIIVSIYDYLKTKNFDTNNNYYEDYCVYFYLHYIEYIKKLLKTDNCNFISITNYLKILYGHGFKFYDMNTKFKLKKGLQFFSNINSFNPIEINP